MSVPFSHVQFNSNSLVNGSSNFNSLPGNNSHLSSMQGNQQLNTGTSFSIPGLSKVPHVFSSNPNTANVCNPGNIPNLNFIKSTPPPNIAPAMLPFHNMGGTSNIGSQNAHGQFITAHNVAPGTIFNPMNNFDPRIQSMLVSRDPRRNMCVTDTSQSSIFQNHVLNRDLLVNQKDFNTGGLASNCNRSNYGVNQEPNNFYGGNRVETNPIINNALFASSNSVNMMPFQNNQHPSGMGSLNGQFSTSINDITSQNNFISNHLTSSNHLNNNFTTVPGIHFSNPRENIVQVTSHLNNNFTSIPAINFPDSMRKNLQVISQQSSTNGNIANRFDPNNGFNRQIFNSKNSSYRNKNGAFSPSSHSNHNNFNHNFQSSNSIVPNNQGFNSKLGMFSPSNARPFSQSPQPSNFRNFNNHRNQTKTSPSRYNRQERDISSRPYNRNFNHNPRFPKWQDNGNQNHFQAGNRDQKFELCCDTCDRSFRDDKELQYHLSQHEKCNYKDCPFEAHPKIVALHKKMQHETGYADKINKLKNDDEIEKWRAERRKRFPTLENIKKRKAEEAERIARGEVVETKDFGNFKKPKMEPHNRQRQRNKFKHRRFNFGTHALERNTVVDIGSDSDSDDDSHIQLSRFKGLNEENLMLNSDSEEPCQVNESVIVVESTSESDVQVEKEIIHLDESECGESGNSVIEITPSEEGDATDKIENPTPDEEQNVPCVNPSNNEASIQSPVKVTNGLALLMNQSDSDDDSPPDEVPISRKEVVAEIVDATQPKETMVGEKSAESKSPETKIDGGRKRQRFNRNNKDQGTGEEGKRPRKFQRHDDYVPEVRKSLLEKLLADDIRHERNVIMQCVRHVVNKKFFGIGAKVKTETSNE